MDKVELLLDVLEANVFPEIRSKMRERKEELLRSATLKGILTVEEIEKILYDYCHWFKSKATCRSIATAIYNRINRGEGRDEPRHR